MIAGMLKQVFYVFGSCEGVFFLCFFMQTHQLSISTSSRPINHAMQSNFVVVGDSFLCSVQPMVTKTGITFFYKRQVPVDQVSYGKFP